MEEIIKELNIQIQKDLELKNMDRADLYLISMILPKANSKLELLELLDMFREKVYSFDRYLKHRANQEALNNFSK